MSVCLLNISDNALQPYDIMAFIPIIEQAGGVVTTLQGERPESGGQILASGDPHIHELALKLLNS
jgi:fructose-1,6-bisphosphatase/inositol monophosphatase family enzyme